MNRLDLMNLIIQRAESLRLDEAEPIDVDFPTDREELWLLLSEAKHLQRAANDLVREIKSRFAENLEENESVRYGDTIYRMSPDRKERITDPDALVDFLGADWPHVVPVTSSTTLRKGGIEAVCEKRGLDPKVFQETFVDVEWGDPKLKEIPLSKAPKYTQKLEHGESTYGRKS